MGERKVLNKYIPPDFDPKLVPRGSRPKDDLVPVRMMLPFTIQCGSCSTFLYKGTKFNSKKEPMRGVEGKYLGIQRFRFFIKCTACLRPLSFLTDPKNADYEMENGGTRTYEVQKDKKKIEKEMSLKEETEEKIDPMKALEKRVLASQREMADLDNLEEIKAMNMRNIKLLSGLSASIPTDQGVLHTAQAILAVRDQVQNNVSHDQEPIDPRKTDLLCEEDEALIRTIRFGSKKKTNSTGTEILLRLDKHDEDLIDEQRKKINLALEKQQLELLSKAQSSISPKQNQPLFKVKRKRETVVDDSASGKNPIAEGNVPKNGNIENSTRAYPVTEERSRASLLALVGNYNSDSDSGSG